MSYSPNLLQQINAEAEALLPSHLLIDVHPYDKKHQRLLQASPHAHYFKGLPRQISIPTADFFTYYLFHKKRIGDPSYPDFDSVAAAWGVGALEALDALKCESGNLRRKDDYPVERAITERLGEATGLSVASQLFRLHHADWNKIPESGRKSLDYSLPETASDTKTLFQVEAKGSCVDDNRRKRSSVSRHKSSIVAKKDESVLHERTDALLIGTIAAFDPQPDSIAKCWIVDPPTSIDDSPYRVKLIHRMSFLASLVSLVSPRSTLATAIQTRLESLGVIKQIADLDGVALRKGSGKAFESSNEFGTAAVDSFFANKSRIRGRAVGGKAAVFLGDAIVFIGFEHEIVQLVIDQKYDAILRYEFTPSVSASEFECRLTKSHYRSLRRRPDIDSDEFLKYEDDRVFEARLSGLSVSASCGITIGLIPLPKFSQAEK